MRKTIRKKGGENMPEVDIEVIPLEEVEIPVGIDGTYPPRDPIDIILLREKLLQE